MPDGYAAPGPKTVNITEGDCAGTTGAAVEVTFENTPLTDVTVSVDPQVRGGNVDDHHLRRPDVHHAGVR